MAALISTPTNIGDLYLIDGPTGKRERITHINGELFSQLNLTEPEMVWYKSFDGKRIQSWVQRPPDFDEGKKYPLILDIHGGPHAAYGYTFDHEIPVAGRARLRRAVPQSARQHELRPGVRQLDSVRTTRATTTRT